MMNNMMNNMIMYIALFFKIFFRFRLFSSSFALINLAAFAASSLSSQFGYAVLSKFSL